MAHRLKGFARGVTAAVLLVAAASADARAEGNSFGGTGLYLTHSAETLEPGTLRIGGYASYTKYDLAVDPEDWDLSPQLAWAPVRNLELMASVALLRHHVGPGDNETGIGDGFVGLKYRPFPRLAALGYVALPTGDEDRGLGDGSTGLGFAGILSFPLGAGLTADLNLGYQHSNGGGPADDDYSFYGLGVSLPLGARTRLFGEVAGRSYTEGTSHDTLQFDLGLRHRFTDRLSFTAGGGTGARGDYGSEDPELRLFAGLSLLLGPAAEKPAPPPPPVAPAAAPSPPVPAPAPAPPPPPPLPAPAPAPAAAPPRPEPAPAPAPPPPPPPPPPPVPVAAPAPARPSPELEAAKQRLTAAEIFFEYDRARLTAEGERALKQVAADLLQFPTITFMIEGHADDRGAATYNKVLGLRRAETVMRYLVKAGVGFERMKVSSQGELRPKVPKKDAQSRAVNRRVVFSALP